MAHLSNCSNCGARTIDSDLCNVCGDPKFEQLQAELEEYRDALQSLYDVQNGPPLLRHKEFWQAAMDKADKLLAPVQEPEKEVIAPIEHLRNFPVTVEPIGVPPKKKEVNDGK